MHVLASDSHDLSYRPPDMTSAFRRLEALIGNEEAHRMVFENPAAILEGRDVRAGDPIPDDGKGSRGASRRHSARTGLVIRPADDLALDWVLTGGEDHSLAATFPAGTRLPPRWKVIGIVAGGSRDHGVVVDGQPWAQAGGWDHFSAVPSRGDEPLSPPR